LQDEFLHLVGGFILPLFNGRVSIFPVNLKRGTPSTRM
jgi:hypothetical protein